MKRGVKASRAPALDERRDLCYARIERSGETLSSFTRVY